MSINSTPLPSCGQANTLPFDGEELDDAVPLDTKRETADSGFVHSFETAGTLDGPGLRYVVFLTGCPMRCLYCHNPDTQKLKQGKFTEASQILDDLSRYKNFLIPSGGGLTVSGGEPLSQAPFVTTLFEGAKEMGLHTTLDTAGSMPMRFSKRLLDATDLVLLDIKSYQPEIYRKVTNFDLAPTLLTARMLAENKKPVWLRYVVVPGLTDGEEAVRGLAKFAARKGNIERVECLPFHKMGEFKWKELGMDYELTETQPPSADKMEKIRDIFRSCGLDAR
ncbi:pyruvate formate lyase-activating protein [Verrucomicrobiaceae bacterium N1E253]|uniref:Pyruvate formate-lyase-activating enzyme n=1 Tax=Oceaniferula marina TaxID=2748318 RepID=A0A851GHE6_9BACT|nr:pyruvate formate-lyase-activating protein [Oceaniferula marina]NWK54020.1 pyruvate formate lyase-activating protein [Oceaniferula marina]